MSLKVPRGAGLKAMRSAVSALLARPAPAPDALKTPDAPAPDAPAPDALATPDDDPPPGPASDT